MALMKPFFDPGFWQRFVADMERHPMGKPFDPGSATVRTSVGIDPARLAAMAGPRAAGVAGPWSVAVLHWHPTPLNKLITCHWGTAHVRKQADARRVADEMALAGVPEAKGKRRVGLKIILGPRQRAADPDAYWKSTLDALVACKRLVNDSREWVELGAVEFGRGKNKETVIELADLPRAARTRAAVKAARRSVAGCCARHADNQACDCLENAEGGS